MKLSSIIVNYIAKNIFKLALQINILVSSNIVHIFFFNLQAHQTATAAKIRRVPCVIIGWHGVFCSCATTTKTSM